MLRVPEEVQQGFQTSSVCDVQQKIPQKGGVFQDKKRTTEGRMEMPKLHTTNSERTVQRMWKGSQERTNNVEVL